ncbi:M20 family metallopeptidase [Jeotgalibacillus proteolyticus]|uniref:Peptidase M20 domain-containing protein 2 n=1 Tax=Jeotgalibacillus proteolyticus TaxID=2082395 RepID=A0A2S5GC64_9BACL|nr:M20 family metallopeptidase [Jeotgalibacillus proteolyticus]PPA70579.1 amidohydrolase [Jeotgalibacillus proteolyticus]
MSSPNFQTVLKDSVLHYIESRKEGYIRTSHSIHARPEIGNEEFYAQQHLTNHLISEGFKVEKGVAGHETAFYAVKESGRPGPAIAFLAEYDALPGLGHACGHNIIGTASIAAAISVASVIDSLGGKVIVLGTPAEEGGPNGSAKGSFVKHGFLNEVDAALMVHPSYHSGRTTTSLAVDPLDFEFIGKPAHAASSPHQGINALDGVISLFNGVNALRQHVPDDVRIHGIITHGGDAPNIIPEYAKARFYIRAAKRETLNGVTEKVRHIAEGAALATGASLNVIAFQNEVDNLVPTPLFDDIYEEVFTSLGGKVSPEGRNGIGSTDAGNISQVVPTIHPYIQIGSKDLVLHTDAFREAAKSEGGDRGLLLGAKSLALTALELYTNQDKLKEIQEQFKDLHNK